MKPGLSQGKKGYGIRCESTHVKVWVEKGLCKSRILSASMAESGEGAAGVMSGREGGKKKP